MKKGLILSVLLAVLASTSVVLACDGKDYKDKKDKSTSTTTPPPAPAAPTTSG